MYRRKHLWSICCVLFVATLLSAGGCIPKIASMPTPEPVTLRFAYQEHTADLDNLFAEFHVKYPWITVQPVVLNRYRNTDMESAIRAGNVDVFQATTWALSLAPDGLLHMLDDMQVADWNDIRDDYYANTWEALSTSGQLWGVPSGLDMMVSYVNLDQASALKVNVPKGNWTLFDFLDLATQMNFPEGTPYSSAVKIFGLCTDPKQMDPVVFIYLYGGSIVDDLYEPTRPTLNDPLTIEAVDWYVSLFTQYKVAPTEATLRGAFSRGGVYEAAARGRCGTWLGWYSNRGGQDIGFDWGMSYAMLPLPSANVDFGLGDVEGYYVTRNCPDPADALKLIRFLSNHAEASGTKLPPRKSLVASEAYAALVGEGVAEQAQSLSNNVMVIPTDTMQGLEQVGGKLIEVVQLCINEDIPAAGPLGEAQQEIERIFQTQ